MCYLTVTELDIYENRTQGKEGIKQLCRPLRDIRIRWYYINNNTGFQTNKAPSVGGLVVKSIVAMQLVLGTRFLELASSMGPGVCKAVLLRRQKIRIINSRI